MNWIEASWSYPPEDLSILLYVVTYQEKELILEWSSGIYTGFYNSELGYCLEIPDSLNDLKYPTIENEYTRVIAWTLLPKITIQLKKWKDKNIKQD